MSQRGTWLVEVPWVFRFGQRSPKELRRRVEQWRVRRAAKRAIQRAIDETPGPRRVEIVADGRMVIAGIATGGMSAGDDVENVLDVLRRARGHDGFFVAVNGESACFVGYVDPDGTIEDKAHHRRWTDHDIEWRLRS